MPKVFNIDEQQLAEPIVIILDGKEYTVDKITTELMARVTGLKTDGSDLNAPIKQLATLVGVNWEELKDVDIRKIGKALEYITNSVTDTSNAKNPSEAEAK